MRDVPAAENGEFICADNPPYREGAVASLQCDEGYAHRESLKSTLTLDDQGQLRWIPPFAECEPVFETLPTLEHGEIIVDSEPPYFAGTVTRFKCDEDSVAFGKETYVLTLLDDGSLEWFQPPYPKCFPALKTVPEAKNGRFLTQFSDPSHEGTTADLICDEGYDSKTVKQSRVRSVNGVLQWDPPSAACYPCLRHLPPAEHGRFTSDEKLPYFEGAVAKVICDEGYSPPSVTQSVATLKGNRLTWSPGCAHCVTATKSFDFTTLAIGSSGIVFLCLFLMWAILNLKPKG